MIETTYTAPAVSQKRLWYTTTAAGIAWIVQGLSGFVIADAACEHGIIIWSIGAGGVIAILIAIGVIGLCIAISGGWIGYRTWRDLSRARELIHAEGRGRGEFMALAGVFISTIFAIGIIWATLIPIIVGPCLVVR